VKLRKSLGVKTAIPRNGFSTSKSSSPVTSTSASPTNSQFEKLVVVSIATVVNLSCDADQLGFLE
jgi:hypothetical protein